MRNTFVICLVTISLFSFFAYGQDQYFTLPSNFTTINSCYNSDVYYIYLLGVVDDPNLELSPIQIIKFNALNESYFTIDTDLTTDMQYIYFNNTILLPTNSTELFCPYGSSLYLHQEYDGNSSNFTDFLFKLSLGASKISSSTFSMLSLLIVFAIYLI